MLPYYYVNTFYCFQETVTDSHHSRLGSISIDEYSKLRKSKREDKDVRKHEKDQRRSEKEEKKQEEREKKKFGKEAAKLEKMYRNTISRSSERVSSRSGSLERRRSGDDEMVVLNQSTVHGKTN